MTCRKVSSRTKLAWNCLFTSCQTFNFIANTHFMRMKTIPVLLLLFVSKALFSQDTTYLSKARNAMKMNKCDLAKVFYMMYKKQGGNDVRFRQSLKGTCSTAADIQSALSADDDDLVSFPNSAGRENVTNGNMRYHKGELFIAATLYLKYMEDNKALFDKDLDTRQAFIDKIGRCIGTFD